MNTMDIREFLAARLTEDETWAHEASLLDENAGYAPDGVHWRWTDSYGRPLRLDPATMAYIDEAAQGILLESVEKRPTCAGELAQLAIQGAYEVAVAVGVHIARHDPARVLREVAAKRSIVRLHEPRVPGVDGSDHCWICVQDPATAVLPDPWPCYTLRLLAAPDAGHPDYQPEWRIV